MKKMCFYFFIVVITLNFTLLDMAFAGEFSADMVQKHGNTVNKSKIYQKDDKMRTEMQGKDGKEVVMIIDIKGKKMLQLMPEQKMVMELPMGENFASWAMDEKTQNEFYEMKLEGTETVNGQICEKYSMIPKKQGLGKCTSWISKKLRCPVKTVGENFSMELTNIKEGGVDDSLFDIPADYKKMPMGMFNMPGMKQFQREGYEEENKDEE